MGSQEGSIGNDVTRHAFARFLETAHYDRKDYFVTKDDVQGTLMTMSFKSGMSLKSLAFSVSKVHLRFMACAASHRS